MDKTDALEALTQAITLLRKLKDEVRALQQHFDLIADEMESLDFADGLPDALADLPDLLNGLHRFEQRALVVELKVGAEVGERE